MALGLHPSCTDRLCKELAKVLKKVVVTHGVYPKSDVIDELLSLDKILPSDVKSRERITSYLGDYPLLEFVYPWLKNALSENGELENEANPKKLGKISGFEDISAVSKNIIESFESLPWKYLVSFPLPSIASEALSEMPRPFAIGHDILIVEGSERTAEKLPNSRPEDPNTKIANALLGLNRLRRFSWQSRRLYIQIGVSGFIGEHKAIAPVIQAENLFKSVCGLMLAMRVFDVGHTVDHAALDSYTFAIHRDDDATWLLHEVHEVDADVVSALKRFEPNQSGSPQFGATQLMQIMMSLRQKEKNARILLAAQWLFESHLGKNELLSFIQSMVVLEILLGDDAPSEEIGLGQLLRNRCAFLIGKSHEERSSILRDFTKIYQVRSQIVHRGKSRLSVEERSLFARLQWICTRVVQEEIRLLKADNAFPVPSH